MSLHHNHFLALTILGKFELLLNEKHECFQITSQNFGMRHLKNHSYRMKIGQLLKKVIPLPCRIMQGFVKSSPTYSKLQCFYSAMKWILWCTLIINFRIWETRYTKENYWLFISGIWLGLKFYKTPGNNGITKMFGRIGL